LQRYLGDVIEVTRLAASAEEAVLLVEIDYVIRRTGESRSEQIARIEP
jgi:hypothetical protein